MARDVPTLWEQEPTWSVAELSVAIEGTLRRSFAGDLWVRGEVRNLKRGRRGMVWFDLVEPGATADPAHPHQAILPVVLFDAPRRQVNARLQLAGGAVRMEDGTEVRISGRLTWWAQGGRLQFAMSDIDPEFTLGRLLADRDRLLRQLDAEGLLDRQARHRLPQVPLRLGLVTSAGSAAEHDVLDELRRSGIGFRVARADVRVQGKEAPRQIVRALRQLVRRDVDVILLVRGGGAATDLAAFDSEAIAREVAVCPRPVITGIGHEVDRSVADEVAHTSHKTPTAAAQALVHQVRDFMARIDGTGERIATGVRHRLAAADRDLADLTTHLARAATASLTRSAHHLDRASGRVEAGARVHLTAETRRIDALERRLRTRAPAVLDVHARRLDTDEIRMRALDPVRALARGWSITHTGNGRVVRSPGDVAPGDTLVTTVAGGSVRSTVTHTAPDERPAETT